jgi:hypothetical protein
LNQQTDVLPDEAATQIQSFLLSQSSPLRNLSRLLSTVTAHMYPLFATALDRLAAFVSASPNIVSAALVLVLAVLILQILSMVHRMVLYFTRLAFRMLFWAAVVALMAAAWQRGLEHSLRDVVTVGGHVAGWVMGVVGVWVREYEKAQAQSQAQGQTAYGGYQQRQR